MILTQSERPGNLPIKFTMNLNYETNFKHTRDVALHLSNFCRGVSRIPNDAKFSILGVYVDPAASLFCLPMLNMAFHTEN